MGPYANGYERFTISLTDSSRKPYKIVVLYIVS